MGEVSTISVSTAAPLEPASKRDLQFPFADSSTYAQSLTPTWAKQLDIADAHYRLRKLATSMWIPSTGSTSTLSSGFWLFAGTDGGLTVSAIDGDGEVLAQNSLPAPPGLTAPDGQPALLMLGNAGDGDGPVVTVLWNDSCPNDAGVAAPDGTVSSSIACPKAELLAFGVGANPLAPIRMQPFGGRTDLSNQQAFRDPRMPASMRVVSLPGTVSRFDPEEGRYDSQKLTWKQTGFSQESAALGDQPLGVVFSDQSLALALHTDLPAPATELVRLDADGNVVFRARTSDDSFQQLATAHDRQGRWLLFATDRNGDLSMLRVDEGHNRLTGYRLLRNDYEDLYILALSVDLAGTAYVATVAGSRDPASWTPLLCRLPEQGRPDCFVISEFVDDIRVKYPGAVYGLTRDDKFVRFDLPQ
jgi:hypothetical protein